MHLGVILLGGRNRGGTIARSRRRLLGEQQRVEREEVAEVQLLGRSRDATVPRDHLRRLVAGARADLRLRPAEGELHGHERRPQVVRADRRARRRLLVQLGPLHRGERQVGAEGKSNNFSKFFISFSDIIFYLELKFDNYY